MLRILKFFNCVKDRWVTGALMDSRGGRCWRGLSTRKGAGFP